MKRWIVRAGDGETVGELVARAFGDAHAVSEGRVFVGRRRATAAGERVRPGDEITVAQARLLETASVLADEDEVVAADKPAGMPTIPDHSGGAHSLMAAVARALGVDVATLHPTSRLDRDVSGVVIFARSARAAARLRHARDEGAYVRRYVALAASAPSSACGRWDVPIGRAKDPRHRAVNGRDAVAAVTRYAVVARAGGRALLALNPETGRTHQLRVHASDAGAPLLGDRTYGGPTSITLRTGRVLSVRRIALHATEVTVPRATGSPLVVASPIPEELRELWRALGGDEGDWTLRGDVPT